MRLLRELADQVLLGTERRSPMMPALPGPLRELLDKSDPQAAESEVRLLRAAGAMAVCARTGFVAATIAEALPEACVAQEEEAIAESALIPLLRGVLDDGPDALRFEALRLLAAKGVVLPPRLLPAALSLAEKTPSLRPLLLPVAGSRGRWLARLNQSWSYVTGGSDSLPAMDAWEHGTPDQRMAFLAAMRRREPERARELLRQAFAELDARERANLLEQMAIGLCPADEDFLEPILADRSKDVRQSAASLLARLPASRYAARMGARLAACLRQERKLFRQVWLIEPPASFGTDWKADALEESRGKSEGLGERAWWLFQIARSLPLAWWSATTGMSPSELVKWQAGTDWSEAILRAWSDAFNRDFNEAWAESFLDTPAFKGLTVDTFDLLARLPAVEREERWLRMLKDAPNPSVQAALVSRVVRDLAGAQPTMSNRFARSVLNEARQNLASQSHTPWERMALCQTLPEFVCLIPPDCLDEATRGWPAGPPDTEHFSKTLASLLAIVEQRKTLHRLLSQRKSP